MPQSDRRPRVSTRVPTYTYGPPSTKSPASDSGRRRPARVVTSQSPQSPVVGSPKRMAARQVASAFPMGTTFDANDKAPEDRMQTGCRTHRPSDNIKDMFDAYDSVVRGTIHIEGVNYSKYESCKDRPERVNGFLDAIKDDIISEVGNGVRREDIKLRVYPGAIKTVVLHYDENAVGTAAHRDPRLVDAEWSLKIDYGIRAKDSMRQQNIAMALYGALTSRYGFSDGKTQNAYKKFIDRGATDISKIVIAKPPEEQAQPQILQSQPQQQRLVSSPQRNPSARPLIAQPLPQPQQSIQHVNDTSHIGMPQQVMPQPVHQQPIIQQQPVHQMPTFASMPVQHHNPPVQMQHSIPAPIPQPRQQVQSRVIHQPPLIVLPRHEAMETVFASHTTPASHRTHIPAPDYSQSNPRQTKPSITPTRSVGRPTPPAPVPGFTRTNGVVTDESFGHLGAPQAPFNADRDRELARLSDEIHRERMKLRGDAPRSYSPQSPDKYYHDTFRNIQQDVRRHKDNRGNRVKRHDTDSEFSDTHYVTTEF